MTDVSNLQIFTFEYEKKYYTYYSCYLRNNWDVDIIIYSTYVKFAQRGHERFVYTHCDTNVVFHVLRT
jgi:hypothetical protein